MATFNPGEVIEGKYRILSLLGEGGMNRVYLVESIDDSRKWALKVTREPGEIDSSKQELYNFFLKEIAILATMKHPALPIIEDYFTLGEQCCVVEEFIEGSTLEERANLGLPSENEVILWGISLCEILQALHKNGIIFRDLKPSNIMLMASGALRLIDFSIARYYKAGKLSDTALLGTPGYAAPECYGSGQSDARSDIYSLGATMHQLITGKDPRDNPFSFKPVEPFVLT